MLHIVSTLSAFNKCLPFIQPLDTLVILDENLIQPVKSLANTTYMVYLLTNTPKKLYKSAKINDTDQNIVIIDYEKFVNLVIENNKSITWQ